MYFKQVNYTRFRITMASLMQRFILPVYNNKVILKCSDSFLKRRSSIHYLWGKLVQSLTGPVSTPCFSRPPSTARPTLVPCHSPIWHLSLYCITLPPVGHVTDSLDHILTVQTGHLSYWYPV